MHVMTTQVLFIFCFLLLIHSIETLAYATRLSGARVGFIASALSLFNVMVIVSRMSNMVQQPFTGHLIDDAGKNATAIVGEQFRFLIFGSTVGTITGIILLPSFVALFHGRLFTWRAAAAPFSSVSKGILETRIQKCPFLFASAVSFICKGISHPLDSEAFVCHQHADHIDLYDWRAFSFVCRPSGARA